MKATAFIKKYLPYAKQMEEQYFIPAVAILAQAGLESGWGEKSIGNNVFGVKYRKGDWGKQLATTTEYYDNKKDFDRKDNIITHSYIPSLNKFKVVLRGVEFADYETPFDAFLQHSKLLLTERYHPCLLYRDDPAKYLGCIGSRGYATDPNYKDKMAEMVYSVQKRIIKLK